MGSPGKFKGPETRLVGRRGKFVGAREGFMGSSVKFIRARNRFIGGHDRGETVAINGFSGLLFAIFGLHEPPGL